jgi:hypothetical protein
MDLVLPLLKPYKDWNFLNMDDLVRNIFDERYIEKLAVHGDGDYQGTIRVIFRIIESGKYFYIKSNYGSCEGCDDWADGNGDLETINRILKDVVLRDAVSELLDDHDQKYEPPDWVDMCKNIC